MQGKRTAEQSSADKILYTQQATKRPDTDNISHGETLFRCVIEGRARIKKNNLQRKYSFKHRRTFTLPSDIYLAWEKKAVAELEKLWGARKAINQPVMLRALFYFENRSGEPDLSNLYEGIQDALQAAGVIKNDRLIQGHDGSRKIFGEAARVEIELRAV